MNNVKMILEKYGKDTIWFYLKDDKTEENFKKELMELGATWMVEKSWKNIIVYHIT